MKMSDTDTATDTATEDRVDPGSNPDPVVESQPEVTNIDFKASFESAAFRAHKLAAILKAHNIDVNLSEISSEGLTVSDGVVYGEVAYSAPAPKSSTPPDPSVKAPISMAQLDSMTSDEINANWDEVVKVLESSSK